MQAAEKYRPGSATIRIPVRRNKKELLD